MKTVLPETMLDLGAQAVLANAYHLYLQPGSDIVDEAGGLGAFMNWPGPTFTDSGGFQVMSLGAGFKKVLAMDADGVQADDVIAEGKERLAHVDDDGVTFNSHLNGDRHRFTPEVSMQIQHQLGADIIFAFDELTTLLNTRAYQERSVERTRQWAQRCVAEHAAPHAERTHRPYAVAVRGDPGRAVRGPASQARAAATWRPMGFDGFGIGGALEKQNLGTIVGWVTDELPEDKPRHLLGISEPDDVFAAVAHGADTFDCVNPSRVARNARHLRPDRPVQRHHRRYRRDFTPIDDGLRLLHLRELHAGLPAPPVQGEGDARLHAGHDPQRAVHDPAGRRHPGQHRRRLLRRVPRGDAGRILRVTQ